MESRRRVGLIIGTAVVAVLGLSWGVWQLGTRFAQLMLQQVTLDAAATKAASLPHTKARPFTSDEIAAFLAAAKKADSIDDPLQRCLGFPDPPGSHWSHDTIVAYCHYTTQSAISVAELTTLIQNDHAGQVDQRMADALRMQRTQPDARGLLDRTFIMDFRDSSEQLRGLLDAWKRQSPNSAFAYAASGDAYVIAAHAARGSATGWATSDDQFGSMGRLLQLADDDFSKALALDPTLTPAYAGMIEAGTYGSHRYGIRAADRGLAVDPSNFSLYVRLMQLSEPKWGGSIRQMQQVATRAQAHVSQDPLLLLLAADAPAYLANGGDCDCGDIDYLPDYRRLFDQAAGFRPLATAGEIAFRNDHSGSALGLVYAAEALRFAPNETDSRVTLTYELAKHGEATWAKAQGDRLVAAAPSSADAYDARGKALEAVPEYPQALDDYNKAFALDSTNPWPLIQIGMIDVHKTHDWDKAWANADQLIQLFPTRPEGWILRLSVEKDQPRAGFHDDGVYFLAHFSDDPNQQAAVREVRQWVAEGKYR
jgi:tetratricopeptide (TPR) repeat protein